MEKRAEETEDTTEAETATKLIIVVNETSRKKIEGLAFLSSYCRIYDAPSEVLLAFSFVPQATTVETSPILYSGRDSYLYVAGCL